MPTPLFTRESGREMAIRSHLPTSRRFLPKPIIDIPATEPEAVPEPAKPDPFAELVMRACKQTLKNLIRTKDPRERAVLARAVRDLRETWHLITGQAKPGMTRPAPDRPNRRQLDSLRSVLSLPEPVQAPACGVQPTTQSVPAACGPSTNTTSTEPPKPQ